MTGGPRAGARKPRRIMFSQLVGAFVRVPKGSGCGVTGRRLPRERGRRVAEAIEDFAANCTAFRTTSHG